MIRNENDNLSVTEKAEIAFRNVAVSVVERAKQTHTPIIIYKDDRIQLVPPDEFEKMSKSSANDDKGGK